MRRGLAGGSLLLRHSFSSHVGRGPPPSLPLSDSISGEDTAKDLITVDDQKGFILPTKSGMKDVCSNVEKVVRSGVGEKM